MNNHQDLSFTSWLRKQLKKRIVWPLGLIPAVSIGVSVWSSIQQTAPLFEKYLDLTLYSLQCGLVFSLLFFLPYPFGKARKYSRASKAVSQFFSYWKLLWLFWIILFAALSADAFVKISILPRLFSGSIEELSHAQQSYIAASWAIKNCLNNLTTITLFILFLILSKETLVQDSTNEWSKKHLPWHQLIALLFLAFILEFGLSMWFLYDGQIGRFRSIQEFSALVGGIAAALAGGLFFSRLTDRIIGLPIWACALLFLYAAIQTGWSSPEYKPYLISLGFVLKLFLYAVIGWLLTSGKLLFFMENERQQIESIDLDWRNFYDKEVSSNS